MSYLVIPNRMPRHVMSHHVMLRHVISCHVISRHGKSCYVTLRHIMPIIVSRHNTPRFP